MNELKGLSQQEVQERIEQGQVNYTGQSISKTKKEIVKQRYTYIFQLSKYIFSCFDCDFRTTAELNFYWSYGS